jgi:hypothetical protein
MAHDITEIRTMIEIKHVSYTGLRRFKKSPKHYLHYLDSKKDPPTDAMLLGSAFHALVPNEKLLPKKERFDNKFVVSPSFDKRTKDGKTAFAEFESKIKDKSILSESAKQSAFAMAESVRFSAKQWIDGLQTAEQELRWVHESGIEVLSYLDGVGADYFTEHKSCQDAEPKLIQRKAWFDGWVHQTALYHEGLKRKLGVELPCFLIAVESSKPYACSVHKIPVEVLAKAYLEVNTWIYNFVDWAQTQENVGYEWNSWKGYYDYEYNIK